MDKVENQSPGRKLGFLSTTSIGSGVGAAILAKASCPLCYPAIGGLLSSVGLGFLFEGHYFLILMGVFFSVALYGLYHRAKCRRGYNPFFLGLVSAIVGFTGKAVELEPVFYLGVTGLVFASIWNLVPRKKEN